MKKKLKQKTKNSWKEKCEKIYKEKMNARKSAKGKEKKKFLWFSINKKVKKKKTKMKAKKKKLLTRLKATRSNDIIN